jgi:hypothetical protein
VPWVHFQARAEPVPSTRFRSQYAFEHQNFVAALGPAGKSSRGRGRREGTSGAAVAPRGNEKKAAAQGHGTGRLALPPLRWQRGARAQEMERIANDFHELLAGIQSREDAVDFAGGVAEVTERAAKLMLSGKERRWR